MKLKGLDKDTLTTALTEPWYKAQALKNTVASVLAEMNLVLNQAWVDPKKIDDLLAETSSRKAQKIIILALRNLQEWQQRGVPSFYEEFFMVLQRHFSELQNKLETLDKKDLNVQERVWFYGLVDQLEAWESAQTETENVYPHSATRSLYEYTKLVNVP